MRNNAIAVPQVAVLDGPQGKFVYVAGKDKDGKDVAPPRPVDARRLGRRRTARICGSSRPGSSAGDKVIVDGIAKLMPGAPIKLGRRAGRRRRRRRPAAPQRAAAPAAEHADEADAAARRRAKK